MAARSINIPISESLRAHLKQFYERNNMEIVEFKLVDEHLSPVRNQGQVGSCSVVATIACIEALYRKLDRPLFSKWDDEYFFDINECFDLLYKELNALPNAARLDKNPKLGSRVEDVLQYIMERGLLATTVCDDSRDRNHVAHFDDEAHRYHVSGYKYLEHDEVLTCLEQYPLIAYMAVQESFTKCRKAIYHGASKKESEREYFNHAVLVVGSLKVKEHGEEKQYLIIQNNHGEKYGFRGYLVVPFDHKVIFQCYWLPLIYPEMKYLPYGEVVKERNEGTEKVYSRRRRHG